MTIIDSGACAVHTERWRPTHAGYEVSCRGRIRGPRGLLKPWPSTRGYLYTEIQGRKYRLHRLVVQAFVGPIPEGMVVDHINGQKTDNRLENLDVVSHRENMDRAKALGLFQGYTGPDRRRTITADERAEILRLRASGLSWPKLAVATGRSKSVLQRVVSRAGAAA